MKSFMRGMVTCLFVLAMSNAQAALVTFDFTGEIYSVSLNAESEAVYVGELISGSFSYDPSFAQRGPLWLDTWHDYVFDTNAFINLRIGGLSWSAALPLITIVNDRNTVPGYHLDRLFLSAAGYGSRSTDFGLWIDGSNGTSSPYSTPSQFLTSLDLPQTAPDLAFAYLGQSPIYINSPTLVASAWVTSLTTRASVPEPATYVNLLAALSLMWWMRNRRSQMADVTQV